uniref:Endonuclease/exonuclease/phosphatase domain-containing protein n=1 Tax=Tetranychus urticae TaxID=32264 RepID=T1K398_TETUR
MLQLLASLDILYGNCGHTEAATNVLCMRCEAELPDLGCLTEVVSECLPENCSPVRKHISTVPNDAGILTRDSDSFIFTAVYRVSQHYVAVKASWCNLKLLVIVAYLSPTASVLSNNQYMLLVQELTAMCSQVPPDALTILLGDFNAYHPNWSNETCRNSRKRTKGEVLKHYTEKAGLMVVNSCQPNCFRGMTETVNDLVFVNQAMLSGLSICETTEHLGGTFTFLV